MRFDKIILSVGHGGFVWGKYLTAGKRSPSIEKGAGFFEGNLTRQIANLIEKEFGKKRVLDLMAGCAVNVSLKSKAEAINMLSKGLNVASIELHTNAVDEDGDGVNEWDSVNGARAFFHPNSRGGAVMASAFSANFPTITGIKNRGNVATRKYYMINKPTCASNLWELGYHNNEEDVEKLQKVNRVAYGCCETIETFLTGF